MMGRPRAYSRFHEREKKPLPLDFEFVRKFRNGES
jgi:hypothetical protein